jgi:hypothetical protein
LPSLLLGKDYHADFRRNDPVELTVKWFTASVNAAARAKKNRTSRGGETRFFRRPEA